MLTIIEALKQQLLLGADLAGQIITATEDAKYWKNKYMELQESKDKSIRVVSIQREGGEIERESEKLQTFPITIDQNQLARPSFEKLQISPQFPMRNPKCIQKIQKLQQKQQITPTLIPDGKKTQQPVEQYQTIEVETNKSPSIIIDESLNNNSQNQQQQFEKKNVCDLCPKTYRFKGDLRRHKMIYHTNDFVKFGKQWEKSKNLQEIQIDLDNVF